MKNKSPKKNYAFVDNANVTVSVARQGRHIDRGKLKGRLERRWNVEKVFMIMGYHPDYESMYEYFRSLGYELVFKPMIIDDDIDLKGNIDTDLVLRVMKEWKRYDKAIILSGDGDFLSLVKHLKQKNKLGQIIVPHSGRYSHFLDEAAGEYITSLTGKKRRLEYKKNNKEQRIKNTSKKNKKQKTGGNQSNSIKDHRNDKKINTLQENDKKESVPPKNTQSKQNSATASHRQSQTTTKKIQHHTQSQRDIGGDKALHQKKRTMTNRKQPDTRKQYPKKQSLHKKNVKVDPSHDTRFFD